MMQTGMRRIGLSSSFGVNEDVFDAIKLEMISSVGSSIPQPTIIIGQDGSGKTTLLRRLYQLWAAQDGIWIDGRTIFSSDYIIDLCVSEKASVVFIDDMDYYLQRCSYDEQFRLRRYLYGDGAPMMIASASKVVPALFEYEAPFFEGLKKMYLNPVSEDYVKQMFGRDDCERALSMFKLLPPVVKSVNLIRDIMELNDAPSRDLRILLSFFSDKFRIIYQGQPTYSQQILNALAGGECGMTMPEIRAKSGLPTNILTAYLKILKNHGLISVDKSVKKNTKYFLNDSLFRIWLR